jgi:uncharacterized protein
MKVVLDTNVWLDVLVFDDPKARRLRQGFDIVIDAACSAELERVLAYPLGKWTLSDERRLSCLEALRSLARRHEGTEEAAALPRCADPDDQKFLALAASAGADVLVTKDEALLRLGGRVPFRIARPAEL